MVNRFALCVTQVGKVAGKQITTIGRPGERRRLHLYRRPFSKQTAHAVWLLHFGMIMSGVGLLNKKRTTYKR